MARGDGAASDWVSPSNALISTMSIVDNGTATPAPWFWASPRCGSGAYSSRPAHPPFSFRQCGVAIGRKAGIPFGPFGERANGPQPTPLLPIGPRPRISRGSC
jgi:hypothetical protein